MRGKGIRMIMGLVLMTGLCGAPQTVRAEQIDFQQKIMALKQKFPNGKYWNHVGTTKDNSDGYTDSPCTLHKTNGVSHVNGTNGCTCNHFAGGGHWSATQCMGFANKLGAEVFGDSVTWTTTKNPGTARLATLQVGDIVRYSSTKESTTGHSVFVIGKNGSRITIAEANYGGPCKIVWGREIDLSDGGYSVLYIEHANNYEALINADTMEPDSTEEAVDKSFTGWKTSVDGVHTLYYKAGVLQKSQWIKIGKKKYYVDDLGHRVTGLVTIGSKQYYFSTKGVLQKKKWIGVDGKDYYAGSSGQILVSQWLYKGSVLVYVKKDGAVAKNEIVKIGSKKYLFNKKGKRSKGFHKLAGKYYYCNSSGVIQKKKWITVKKKKYYLQKNGVRVTNTLKKIGKYQYYFNEKGQLVTGKRITYNHILYKADKKGRCKKIGEVEDVSTPDKTDQNL